MPRNMGLWLLGLVGIWSFGCPTLGSKADTARACYRVDFDDQRPEWISGALAQDKSPQIIVVDPIQNKLLAYGLAGESISLPAIEMKAKEDLFPVSIGQTPEAGLLLELADGTLVSLNQGFNISNTILPPQETGNGNLRIGSLYQWEIAGHYIVAYGSLLDSSNNVKKGFFRFPLGVQQPIPEMLTPLEDSEFYVIGNRYIAAIGSTTYYVVMGKFPKIVKAVPGRPPEDLTSFPENFRLRPDFKTKLSGPRSAAAHFGELESFSVVSGIFAQDGFLYILGRKPLGGETGWYLYRLDPGSGEIVPQDGNKLPTSAHHLTVALSRGKWFLVERGSVERMQRQDIRGMVIIDSSAIMSRPGLPPNCPKLDRFARSASSMKP